MRDWIPHCVIQVLALVSAFCLLIRGAYFHMQYALAHNAAHFGARVSPEVFYDQAGEAVGWVWLICLGSLVAAIATRRLSWIVCFAGCLLLAMLAVSLAGARH